AGAKFSWDSNSRESDGGKRARSPGRARYKPLKPLRREGRMIRSHLWFYRVLLFMHADRGCELAPGLPCALVILEGMTEASTRGARDSGQRARKRVSIQLPDMRFRANDGSCTARCVGALFAAKAAQNASKKQHPEETSMAATRIDCDIHPSVGGTRTTLLPYLDDHWKEQVVSRAIDGLDLTSYPPNM